MTSAAYPTPANLSTERPPLRPFPRHVPVACVGPSTAGGEVFRLDRGDLVGRDAMLGDLGLQIVEARGVAAEDGALHRAVGGAQRLETVLLLHVLGDLETAHGLDPPPRRGVPEWLRPPDDVV